MLLARAAPSFRELFVHWPEQQIEDPGLRNSKDGHEQIAGDAEVP